MKTALVSHVWACDKASQPSRGQKRKQTNCWSANHHHDHDDHDDHDDCHDIQDDHDDHDNGGLKRNKQTERASKV